VTLGSNAKTTIKDASMYLVLVQAASAAAPSSSSGSSSGAAAPGAGIPFGFFHLPNANFGSAYDGALRNIGAAYLLGDLAAIKTRGGKVMLALSGNRTNYTNANGTFNLTKWKAQVDKFRGINFASYLADGTVIGHYLTDEPNCTSCWGGTAIPPATLEAMAQYSKSIWPTMTTVVRTYPDYLNTWSGTYKYLDAAWAQYVYRKGDAAAFMTQNVALAQKKGLALVVGLNILKGGVNNAAMTASQVQSWGTALLNNAYTCAFLSWQYDAAYLSRSDIKSAMAALHNKAQSHTSRSCRST
jgi:hypothetical protein